MKVKLATTAGFCMGVRRAMELVLAEANRSEAPIYTFGPLIHNMQVLDLLMTKGVRSVKTVDNIVHGNVVIRAHGIPPQQRQLLEESSLRIIDGTCPRVAHVQAIIRHNSRKGMAAVIVGDKEHPEVIGLQGYSEGPVHVINSVEDIKGLSDDLPLFIVAQTTQDEQVYEEITREILKRFPGTRVFETICDATHHRQNEVRSLAAQVDGMIVVGGYHSGNTKRLVQISRAAGLPTFHIETENELEPHSLSGMSTVGVTAGASTPSWMIKNVVKRIEDIQSSGENRLRHRIKKISKFFLLSNLVVGGGAASLSYASNALSGKTPGASYPAMTFLYIFAMHVLNRFLDKGASAYNDPERAAFYRKHHLLLSLSGLCAIVLALFLAYGLGKTVFFSLAALSIVGLVYSVPLIPSVHQKDHPYAKIKDIPGSKTLSESLAWVAVIAVLPALDTSPFNWTLILTTSSMVFLLSYARSGLFDILQLQGDLIVGRETLPITLGLKKTSMIIKLALLLSALILVTAPLLQWMIPLSYLLLACVLGLYLCLSAYEKQWIYPGLPFEALLECNFLLAGVLAILWVYLPWL
ncbi:MAG: 4-hydroxy-3-methylbut-2-enyl diphosphate reductase [Desulfatiglandaceae bacterium]